MEGSVEREREDSCWERSDNHFETDWWPFWGERGEGGKEGRGSELIGFCLRMKEI